MGKDMNAHLFTPSDSLHIGLPDDQIIKGTIESCELYNFPYTILNRDEIMKKYP